MDYLNVVQWNAQSLPAHKYLLINFLQENQIHVALICETWLKSHIHFRVKNYDIIRLDTGSRHNGVAILVHNRLQFLKIDTSFDDSLQNIAVRLKYGNKEISLVSVYSPGNCDPVFTKAKLNNLISNIPEPMLIAGDFNARHTAWGCASIDIRGRDIIESINDNGLVVLNDGQYTTVGSSTWQRNALDLTLVSPSLAFSCEWSVCDDPMGSYHLPVMTKIAISNYSNTYEQAHSVSYSYFNFRLVDWQKYSDNIDLLLQNFQCDELNPLVSYSHILELLKIPLQQSDVTGQQFSFNNQSGQSSSRGQSINRKKRISLPWWNSRCAKAVEDCKKAYIEFKHSLTEESYIHFKKLQAVKKLVLKKERNLGWLSLCETLNRCTPVSRIWRIVKRFNGRSVSFKNVYSDWIMDFLKKYTPDTVEAPLDDISSYPQCNSDYLLSPFNLQEFKNAVFSRRDTAHGLDGIPYKMLKNTSDNAKTIILSVYNMLWSSLVIPMEWKKDCLVPILKPNKDKTKADSYRPIALTSCMGKIFEQLLKQRLEFFIESNFLLPSNQFGFRRGRSSRESIAHLQLEIFDALKQDNVLVGVFFDVVGAFNNVNHHILAQELFSLGVPVKFVKWIFKFLHGREVYVKSNNGLIGPRYSYRGVCQGGILSPLIYILYVHKLNYILGSQVKSLQFADDLVIYFSGSDIQQVSSVINSALLKLNDYFCYLNLDISPEKSKVVVFGECDSDVNIVYNNICLPIESEVKFLGVIFSSNLSWNKYVDYLLGRAFKAFNVIKSLSKIDPKILLMLYKSIVRSHFEYGFLCFGSDPKLVKKLDVLQNHNMRCITGSMKTTPINSLQVECNIPPLKLRFKYLKSKFILKLLSISPHPLFKKLQYFHSVYFPLNVSRVPYILHNFSEFIDLKQQNNIHLSNNNWTCYTTPYDVTFCNMNIQIYLNLKHKEQVYEKLDNFSQYKQIYTDGSKTDNNVSMAIYIPYLKTGHGVKLPEQMSIFSAEGLAIFAALQFVEEKVQECKHWIVLTDSMSCLKALQSNKFDSGFNYILYDIRKLYFKLTGNGIDIILMWVPSHSGVSGNENADKLARIITSSSNVDNDTVDSRNIAIPFTDFIPKFKLQLKQNWLTDWEETLRDKGKWYNKINNNICRPWFTNSSEYFSRKFYNTIMRLRFGHCRFNSHLHRMQIISSPLCTNCNLGVEQTLNHIFFECHAYNIQRLVLADRLLAIYKTSDSIPRDIQDILTNPVTYKDIYNFIISTGLEL